MRSGLLDLMRRAKGKESNRSKTGFAIGVIEISGSIAKRKS